MVAVPVSETRASSPAVLRVARQVIRARSALAVLFDVARKPTSQSDAVQLLIDPKARPGPSASRDMPVPHFVNTESRASKLTSVKFRLAIVMPELHSVNVESRTTTLI